jgi:hypothetical protein
MSNDFNILIRLAGGLGNQLFQFSAATRLAQCHNLPFSRILIDTRFLASYESTHKYDIDFVSNLFQGVQINDEIAIIPSLVSRFRIAKFLDTKVGSFNMISSVKHLKELLTNSSKASTFIMDGYFQSPEIIFIEEDRKRISFNLISTRKVFISQLMNKTPTIGVHIRRGDYITSKSAAKVFCNIPLEYYDAALCGFQGKYNIFVFSDDRELSALYAARVGGVDVRQFNLSLQDEFCLLMACDDYIIGNSTFSWWAAYLGHKAGGRVISPRNWFRNQKRNQTNPLLLPHFELIDA